MVYSTENIFFYYDYFVLLYVKASLIFIIIIFRSLPHTTVNAITGKSIDNSLTQNYQPLEYENPPSIPKFISRGQSYRAVIGDTIVLPCATQDLG
jgi:hypothetical protein